MDSGGPKKTLTRWGPDTHTRMGNFEGFFTHSKALQGNYDFGGWVKE